MRLKTKETRSKIICEAYRAIDDSGESVTWAALGRHTGLSISQLRRVFPNLPAVARASGRQAQESLTRDQVLARYRHIALTIGGRSPTLVDLNNYGLTRNTVRYHFATREALDAVAREQYPDVFKDVPVTSVEPAAKPSKVFVITSPVLGAQPNDAFCQALRTYADRRKADILALPVADPASRATPNGEGHIHKSLLDLGFKVVRGDIEINSNLTVLGVEISAKQIQPTTGLLRFGQRGKSLIVPSPKRFLQFVPTLGKTPHAVMTPGSCTWPNYDTDLHRSKRTAYLAEQDHIQAALVIEVEDDKRFHFRQLTWSEKEQNFLDLGETHDGAPEPFLAVQPGDWHSGATDPVNYDFVLNNALGAKWVFLHDSFDGESINHHTPMLNHLAEPRSLRQELAQWAEDVEKISRVYERVYIVQSNHDERLRRWLLEGRHLKDRVNFSFARTLEPHALAKLNPLESWLEAERSLSNVIFLTPDDSLKIGGVEMSQHGHLGGNGSKRPSLAALEKSLGPCCVGHSHTPGIWREAWQAGTCTPLRLDYTEGPSSWFWSHVGIYADGRRQMINLIP